MENDIIFSDDVQLLRHEIVRLRALLDTDWRVSEQQRLYIDSLNSIISTLINNNYGK